MRLSKHVGTLALFCAAAASAAPAIFPLRDVRAGQKGVGKTVFAGTKVDEFQADILGVLQNVGPGQSVILARLSGGPLEKTGVMQGMSGSPVYIDGKLLGAVALGFIGEKDAIAGIRPIEEMLKVDPTPQPTELAYSAPSKAAGAASVNSKLADLATPLAFSGFSSAVLDRFGSALRALGMEPRQGVSGGGAIPPGLGDPKLLEPGSMISVQLMAGDMNVSADGTITMIDDDRVYAFGHRFLAIGPAELPFARAEVLALLPDIQNSFKISQPHEWMGTITADRNAAVSGLLGKAAATIPILVKMGGSTYSMQMVQDRVMTPLLAQMALASVIDGTERAVGSSTYTVNGTLDFQSGPVRLESVYSGDVAVGALASLSVATPLSFAMSTGFDALKLKGVTLDVAPIERRRQLQVADLTASRVVRAGDELDIAISLAGENGADVVRHARYRVPVGTPPGLLNLTISDAASANLTDFGGTMTAPARSAEQVLGVLNSLHPNTHAYLRVWRAGNSFTVDGRDMPDPPPSVASILTKAQPQGTLNSARGAKIAEIEVPVDGVTMGSKTIQVEVRD